MATFQELHEIGSKVREIYFQDPEAEEWFNSIAENQESFPPDTFNCIVEYLQKLKTKESSKLVDLLLSAAQEDETENILYAIFNEDEGDENFTGEDQYADDIIIPDDFGEEECEDQQLNNPQAFFDNKIDSLKSILNISYDLSYLLLKEFNWDENLIVGSWVNSNKEPLKKLNINFGSSLFPSPSSELVSKSSGKGTCPICCDDTDLYQLYCGHKLCKDCLIAEIICQIESKSLPVCRSSDNKGNQCKSEIIPSDIEQFIEDSTILDNYYQILLQSEIHSCPGVRECPNCKILITSDNDLGCHTGQCPQCHYTTCLKCLYPGSHAPLLNCDHINDFTIVIKNKMAMLDQAQKLWYIREEKLKDYRKSHQNEFKKYFDGLISDCTKNFKQIDNSEMEKIRSLDAMNSEKGKQLNALLSKRNSKTATSNIQNEIAEIQKEIDRNNDMKSLYVKEHRVNSQDREKYIHRLTKLKQFFIWSITEERHKFQYGITKFKNKLNRLVSQKLSKPIDLSGDNAGDNSSKVTKKCPHCHVTIYKQGGCNYVQCLNCRYEFCWICNQPWVSPHGDHFFCPNYSLSQGKLTTHVINGVDYDNIKDKTFYPMPLDPNKMTEFVKYNNLHMEYQKNIEKIDQLEQQFLPNENEQHIRYRLISCLKKENSEEIAKNLAERIFTDILFAQSVIAWGYAELFYITKEISYNLFEYRIFQLEKLVNDFIQVLSSYELIQPTSYFEQEIELIRKEINNILISSETQT